MNYLADPGVNLGNDTSICVNAGITLDAGAGFTNYLWSLAGNSNRTLYVTSDGNYWVTVTDGNGCTNSDTVTISQYTSLVINLGDDIVLCEGNDTTLVAPGGASWLWSTDETTQSIEVSATDNYWVKVTDASGCTGTDNVNLQIQPPPVLHITGNNLINSADSTELQVTGAGSYLWSPDTLLNSATGSQVYAKPLYNTTFNVTGTDEYGCSGSDSILINVFCPSKGRYTVIDTVFGTIDFTCSNRVYRPNDTSSWLLVPKGADKIYINFNYGTFDIHPGDTVRVYEGHDNTGKLLAKYNNKRKPGSILTANFEMYIEFMSNSSGTGKGFLAYFWTNIAGATGEVQEAGEMKIYPNPFRESTIIEFPNPDFAPYKLILMDLSGKIHLITGQITGSRYELQRENLENGFYIIELVGPQVFRGRILIE
jgi:hypothetical protein